MKAVSGMRRYWPVLLAAAVLLGSAFGLAACGADRPWQPDSAAQVVDQKDHLPGDLMLPAARLEEQRAGGTWSELFDTSSWINRNPALAAAVWYLTLTLAGWVVYPFTRLALRGLPDRGFPLARVAGLLLLAYPVWLLGSYRVPFSPQTISLVFLGLVVVNLVLAVIQRQELLAELRERWKYLLLVEAAALAFFILFLLVRWGNPDLWHPWKGGEKPMDFSYFNAILKSTSFPPYDPWYAGGYINYYYYGYVLVGVPVKWLGIVPSVAYNLILPSLYSLLAMGAFSAGWNLLAAGQAAEDNAKDAAPAEIGLLRRDPPYWAGLSAALGAVFLGNLGTARMIWHGLQRLAVMQVPFEEASFITRVAWTFEGLFRLLTVPGTRLPFGRGEWYWIPSRAIPGEPITEFPAFTFLYADLHAHMMALPVTVLALAWAASLVLTRWRWRDGLPLAASLLLGALAIGALRPTNTWDWPTYLAIGSAAVGYAVWQSGSANASAAFQQRVLQGLRALVMAGLGIAALAALSTLLYQPFAEWYGQGYNRVDLWQGSRTPIWSYLTHWGLFLFILTSWMACETIDWMARTPLSALSRLRPLRGLILGLLAALAVLLVGLHAQGVTVGWLALPLAAWAGALLLRPNLLAGKRVVAFITGTALALTLFVEVAVLQGDIGRMNTVFKFYLQAWVLLSVAAGTALLWLLPALAASRNSAWKTAWEWVLALLVAGAALFPLLAGADKISDRMAMNAPRTLDGAAYMTFATYHEQETLMRLDEDYQAIRWLQENVKGSPVIVEANVPEYRWGSRYTIYTGLPGVVGWNWHQRQQRAINPGEWVFTRVADVNAFYNTENPEQALSFLQRYAVKYIIVGQLEKAVYQPGGIEKFEAFDGSLWQEVYRQGQTAVYEVMRPDDH